MHVVLRQQLLNGLHADQVYLSTQCMVLWLKPGDTSGLADYAAPAPHLPEVLGRCVSSQHVFLPVLLYCQVPRCSYMTAILVPVSAGSWTRQVPSGPTVHPPSASTSCVETQ